MIIENVQLDPYGYCNSKCWYCPVRYEGNIKSYNRHMSIELMDNILTQLISNKGTVVSDNFYHCYVSHYNEILLYKYFDEMLELFRKHKLMFMILSNGVPLTEDKIKKISEYQDVISGISLNIPSIDKEIWMKYTNQSETDYNCLMNNLSMVDQYLYNYINNKSFSIGVNGLNRSSLYDNGGWVDLLPDMIDYNIDNELDNNFIEIKNKFPMINVFKVPDLIDRAGMLHNHNIFSNYRANLRYKKNKVIGCINGNRIQSWLHINSLGECFLCCNDYYYKSIFADLKTDKLLDFYNSSEHQQKIKHHYNTMCLKCSYARWE